MTHIALEEILFHQLLSVCNPEPHVTVDDFWKWVRGAFERTHSSLAGFIWFLIRHKNLRLVSLDSCDPSQWTASVHSLRFHYCQEGVRRAQSALELRRYEGKE